MPEIDSDDEWNEQLKPNRGKKRKSVQKRKCCCLLLGLSLLLVVAIVISIVLMQLINDDSTYMKEKLIILHNSNNSRCWMPVYTPDTREEDNIRCRFEWASDNQRTEYADAILFSGVYQNYQSTLRRFFSLNVPDNPNTQIVYANCRPIVEPLLREWSQMHSDFPRFTLTMTQKLDSDIVVRNHTIKSRNFSTFQWWEKPKNWTDRELLRDLEEKKGFVIGVFEKKTNGIRDKLLMDLHKYAVSEADIRICWRDIFPCGDSYNSNSIENYKFYLAFEEDLCTDHITYHFYKALLLKVVPVVFGGANYSRIAPPHSYINAEDFGSTRELVDYLSYLDQHPQEYVEYFWWRDWYKVERADPLMELCRLIHKTEERPRRVAKEFWTSSKCRTSTKLLDYKTEQAANGSKLE